MSPLNEFDTLSMLKSVYFFIANTSKVESNKIIQMRFKTLTIKVFIFIYIYLLSFLDRRMTLTLNVPIYNYTISKLYEQSNRYNFIKIYLLLKYRLFNRGIVKITFLCYYVFVGGTLNKIKKGTFSLLS